MFTYYLMRFISKIFCILPLRVGLFFGRMLGNVSLAFLPDWRLKMATANVEECLGLPHDEAEEVAKESVRKFGRMIVEVLRFPLLNRTTIDQVVKTEGLEYLEEAYAQNKGVIMATGHFGNWELLGATVALHGYPMLSIARKQNNGAMDQFINDYRAMVGQKVAYNRGKGDLLSISRMLRDKKLLGILFDQDTNDTGVHMELFGKPVVTPAGPAVLSRMFGSPILPIFMHYDENGQSYAKIYPPLYTPKTRNKEEDVRQIMEQLVDILEAEIRSNPPMWFWVHDRWKDGKKRFGPL